ncbi:alpha/beta fold hydrolase [Maribacter sp. 2210JD10-5]|uniref:alpha/beta fold hydrolase n=1 Tax=Maribacter sp. 2210JD10-5 TaxID=3386272 RepID=UPI0039BD55F8
MELQIVDTKFGKVEYVSRGNGNPILFLHGGHSNCHETLFHKGFNLDEYRLITPSRPGYGKTPLNKNDTLKSAARLIVSFLDTLGVNTVVLYAISAAGPTAMHLAANYPERIHKLVLASAVTQCWLPKNSGIYRAAKLLFNPKVEWITWGAVRLFSPLFPNLIAKNFHSQFSLSKSHDILKTDVYELLSTFKHFRSKRGFLSDIEHKINDDIARKISIPTIIVHSKNDNSVSFDHALHAQRLIENSRLIGLDNKWGHMFWIGNDANDTTEKIIDFIAS